MAACKYCGTSIGWVEVGGSWKATNGDGSRHYCDRTRKATRTSAMQQTVRAAEAVTSYEAQVIHISADQWDELVDALGRIEKLLERVLLVPSR